MTANPFIYDSVDGHIRKFTRVAAFYVTIPARQTPKPHAKKHFLYAFLSPKNPSTQH